MKTILVLSANSDAVNSVKGAVGTAAKVGNAPDITTALTLHSRHPFDTIIVDMDLLDAAAPPQVFSQAAKRFTVSNPLVQFIAMVPADGVRRAVKAVKEGAGDYITWPVEPSELKLVMDGLTTSVVRDLELDYLRDRFWKTEWLEIVQSKNQGMRRVYDSIRSVAPTMATVLLLGDTGTGKGLFARLIHWHSKRCTRPFIAVHCGAIPDTLLESELFGHEKGSFTGAERRKPGKFEMAQGGTIFLDEIGTITPAAQVKLLQVLQDGTFSRVGGEQVMTADVRIITATNSDLGDMVKGGDFRSDLYYRLNVFPVKLPPLKERLEDIPYLVERFLSRLNAKYQKGITGVDPAVEKGLRAYDWPGNIRELENLLERAYILETGSRLSQQYFPAELVPTEETFTVPHAVSTELPMAEARHSVVEAFEEHYIRTLLTHTRGRIKPAAEKAGITPRQLNRLISRYTIDRDDYRTPGIPDAPSTPSQ